MSRITWRGKLIKGSRHKGQAMVEFALIALVLLSMLYGLLEISRLLLINSELTNAAREGAQYAALHPSVSKATLRSNVIGPKLTLIDRNAPESIFSIDDPTFPTVNGRCGGLAPFCPVQVSVTFTYTSMINIMPDMATLTLRPLGPIVLHAASLKLIEGR